MYEDDNVSLYAYALAAAGAIFASIWLLAPQQIEVARLSLDAVEVGEYSTASIASGTEEGASGLAGWNHPDIPWRSYEDGLRLMSEQNKPGVLVLQAEWCLVCRSYQRLYHDIEVERFAGDFIFMLADIDREPEVQKRFDVDGDYIPRTFLLKPDGSLALEATGGHARQKFFVDPFDASGLADLLRRGL